ncbi:MAG: hypothetical protein M1825_003311 [Sarcosagium campestre]|nr:MAG: hypothetical protein M1825_003311 [Sarcosagium campestre]
MSLDRKESSSPDPQNAIVQTNPSSSPSEAHPNAYKTLNASASFPNSPITRLEIMSTHFSTPFITSVSGAIGGLASGVVTCPLDVIKTKLQAQGGFKSLVHNSSGTQSAAYRGLMGTAASIWTEDGIRGMYRGLFPMVLGYFPTWAVYFTVYDSAKDFWFDRLRIGDAGSRKKLSHLLAALSAGGCSTMITNPIWVIKTRLMSQVNSPAHKGYKPPWQYKGTIDAARNMYLNEGIRSFYSGLTPALLGLTHVAVQFPLYEYLKFEFTGLEMGQERKEDDMTNWLGMSVATVLSKVCASTATYPHEVLRTRLQTQQRSVLTPPAEGQWSGGLGSQAASGYTRSPGPASSDGMRTPPRYQGIIQTIQTILKEEGWRAFYVGMGTNMIRAVPAATTTILTYEYMVGRLKRLQSEGNRKLDQAGRL